MRPSDRFAPYSACVPAASSSTSSSTVTSPKMMLQTARLASTRLRLEPWAKAWSASGMETCGMVAFVLRLHSVTATVAAMLSAAATP